ncbi:hypothetical protein L484_009271 [Morus notabilis]|uniref:Uncharacterized protein n=1 Tax=Morus notabilis TaxID=981085 RepID=W9SSU9_9ROSA|nr:uncharacterized protein LOC21392610 [Morus notabilis]EXC24982.1 hypothetical protein L484_009271 [Morus notabilis]
MKISVALFVAIFVLFVSLQAKAKSDLTTTKPDQAVDQLRSDPNNNHGQKLFIVASREAKAKRLATTKPDQVLDQLRYDHDPNNVGAITEIGKNGIHANEANYGKIRDDGTVLLKSGHRKPENYLSPPERAQRMGNP